MKKYKGLYIKSYHSDEIDYKIHFVFGLAKYIGPLFKEVTGQDNDDDDSDAGFEFHPPIGREVYIYINTYDSEYGTNKEQFYMDTIIHETIHGVQRMFDYLQRPVEYDEGEPFAYYGSYRIRKGLGFIEEIKSLDNY